MENCIFAVDTCSENVKEVLERTLGGLIYDDNSYSATYNGIEYDVYQCEVFGIDTGSIIFYRLVA